MNEFTSMAERVIRKNMDEAVEAKRKSVERAQTDEFIIDAARRKGIPVYSGFVRYFPDAILAVAELSRIDNDQNNPGTPLHWDRSKSGDELDALMRHVLDDARGESVDSDGVLHKTKVAWRAMADLQKALERKRTTPLDQEWVSKVSRETEGDENSKPKKLAEARAALTFRRTGESEADYIQRLNTGWKGDMT